MGMYHRMALHFHEWIDFDGAGFSIELLEWGRTFFGSVKRKFCQVHVAWVSLRARYQPN